MCGYACVWMNISSLWHGKDKPFEFPISYVTDSDFWNTLRKPDIHLEAIELLFCKNGCNLFLRNCKLLAWELKNDIFSSCFLGHMISISQSLLLALPKNLKWILNPFRFWVWDGLEGILLWYLHKVYFSVPILALKKSVSSVWNVRKICKGKIPLSIC